MKLGNDFLDYSASQALSKLRCGMNQAEVEDLMGVPEGLHRGQSTIMSYGDLQLSLCDHGLWLVTLWLVSCRIRSKSVDVSIGHWRVSRAEVLAGLDASGRHEFHDSESEVFGEWISGESMFHIAFDVENIVEKVSYWWTEVSHGGCLSKPL